jgi:tetratricopeptide (TPR) repeat protein
MDIPSIVKGLLAGTISLPIAFIAFAMICIVIAIWGSLNLRSIKLGKWGRLLSAIVGIISLTFGLVFNFGVNPLQIFNDPAKASYKEGQGFASVGRYERAIASYESALKLNPTFSEAWYMKGVALEKLGRYKEALEAYDQALVYNQKHSSAWYRRGTILMGTPHQAKGYEFFSGTVEIIRPDALKPYEPARSYGIAYNDALTSLTNAVRSNSHWNDISSADAWEQRGIVLEKMGWPSEAIYSYEQSLKVRPSLEVSSRKTALQERRQEKNRDTIHLRVR